MLLYLYKFSKKENSTKQPSDTPTPYTVGVTLKEKTDVIHPVFILTDFSFMQDYNYAKCVIYGMTRYYFVNKIEYITAKLVYMHCELDYLATWKTEITSSTQFIERSSDLTIQSLDSALLNDSMTPAVVNSDYSLVDSWSPFDTTGGYYVLGINGSGITQPLARRGSVSYVIMNDADLNDLILALYALSGSLGDLSPIQYIASCVYIPIKYVANDFYAQTDPSVQFSATAGYQIALTYRYFREASLNQTNGLIIPGFERFNFPSHPQLARGAYLNYEPYTKIHVTAGVFGNFDLPINMMLRGANYLITIDQTDGSAILEVRSYDATEIYMQVSALVGVPVQLAQSVSQTATDKYKVYSGIISSLGAALTFNVGKSISDMGGAIMSAHEGNIPKITTSGANGSLASLTAINTYAVFNEIVADDTSHVGRPIMENKLLSAVTTNSFVKCRNARIEIPGLLEETRAIESHLNNGFYIE